MARKETPEKEMESLKSCIRDSVRRWNSIRENGCSDPHWPDGCNMNLARNHIIFFKREMLDLCARYGLDLPEEATWDVPPEVPDRLFIGDKESDRCKKLEFNYRAGDVPGLVFLSEPLLEYDPCPPGQMSLF